MSNDDENSKGSKNTAGVDGHDAKVEKHEEKPVHIALIMDATASRTETIARAQQELHRQMGGLRETMKDIDSLDGLQISLVTYGGGEARLHGTFDNPEDVAKAFEQVECIQDLTRICDSLNGVKDLAEEGKVPEIDAVFLVGDTADGFHFAEMPDFETVELGTDKYGHPIMRPNVGVADTDFNLDQTGRNFGAPIITMIDASHQTTPREHKSFKVLADSSGVKNCPLMYNANITFADYMLATAAMVAGPEAVQELKDKELVDPKVWDGIAPETVDSVHDPVIPPEPVVVYRDREIVREVEVEVKRRIWPWVAGGFVAGAIAGCLLCGSWHQEDSSKGVPVNPKIDDDKTLIDDFRRTGNVTFSDINSPVNFKTGSTEITPEFAEHLDRIGALLVENPDGLSVLIIEGHASTPGSDLDNLNLSKLRAGAVLDYLERYFPDITIEMVAVGCGERDLAVDPELTLGDKDANRRVVLQTDGLADAQLRGCEVG